MTGPLEGLWEAGEVAAVERLRARTPLLAGGRVHLNHAGASPMDRATIEAVEGHQQLEHEIGGYEAAAEAEAGLERGREALARCIGADASEIAYVESATAAYSAALSAFDWQPGDVILLSRFDYASNQIMALSLQRRRRVRLVRADDLPEGGVDPDSVRTLIRVHRPKLVSMTHMPTSTGLVQDVEAVGAICAEYDVPYLVDACQTVGQMPIDVEAIRCDFLAATGRKYLRGPRGTGLLYVAGRCLRRDAAPIFVDMRGADWTRDQGYDLRPDARRFELWESNVAARLGLGASAELALQVGLDRIAERSARLAERVRERAREVAFAQPIDVGGRQGAIVSLRLHPGTVPPSAQDAQEVVLRLREQGVNTSAIDLVSARLDLEERGGGSTSALRVSPHVVTTEAEIERFFEALEDVLDG